MRFKEPIILALGLLIGWIISTWTNSPGKYQVTAIIHPETHIMQSCLLDTRTGRIRQLTYGLTKNWFWDKPEAFDMKDYDQTYYHQ
jgi:hypothetical protein